MNAVNYTDFMIDQTNNGINDTLIFELTTDNANGNFIFVINLFDKNGILTNETNITLNSGINKLNITFSSVFLSQHQFNYSIKIYNSTYSLKYRRDNILTKNYPQYEEGFKILNLNDLMADKTLKINITLNSSINGTFESALFLAYNNSIISAKENKSIIDSEQYLIFNFDNETIKRTHYTGNFNISSLKIGNKIIKTNFMTGFYDYRDFAATSHALSFTDNGGDTDSNNKYNFLQINASLQIINNSYYAITLALYDLLDNLIEIKNVSTFLYAGKNVVPINFNGSRIYDKKLNGPFIVKYIELYENDILRDRINNAYITRNYNFNDFESPDLPDLSADVSVSDGYHYGIGNLTINVTFKNTGKKHAFNVFTEIFDNDTFSRSNKSNLLNVNSQITYQINFTNISDFEISAIADLQDFVEELNESNNARRIAIKLNKKPNLTSVNDIIVNETDKILINLSALDPNGDKLFYSINSSSFSNNSNAFEWKTTTIDSGIYTLAAIASDGFLNDSAVFRIIILDVPEKDIDNDGINDTVDTLIGNENSINTSTIGMKIFVGESNNLSRLFSESARVKFLDNNLTISEFDFNFSRYKLNLTNITINKQSSNLTGSLIIRGLKLPEGATKTLYVDKINNAFNGICIKDEEISSINEISGSCNSNNEFKVECDGTLQNSFTCAYNSTLNKYKVTGLKHSGILQIAYAKSTSESSIASVSTTSGSSGGGGGGGCISSWQCSEWSQCTDGIQNRKCSDKYQCPFAAEKPEESKQCNTKIANENFGKTGDKPKKSGSNIKNQGISPAKSPNGFSSITGQAINIKSNLKNLKIVDFAAVFLVLAACYLAVANIFFILTDKNN